MPVTRAAVVQDAPVAFDRERTLDRVAALTAGAAATGAQLVVFPEAFVSGYPKGADFGARVGSRSPEGREWFRRYAASAVEIPGPATDRLCCHCTRVRRSPRHRRHRARRRDPVLHRAVPRAGRGAARQASQGDADGHGAAHLGLRRRVDPAGRPTPPSAGSVPSSAGRTTCRSCGSPCTRAVSSCTARRRSTIARPGCRPCATSRSRAAASSSRQASTPSGATTPPTTRWPRPATTPSSSPAAAASSTRSGACLPDRPVTASAILVADLDLDEITRAKFDLDVVGHYARPDIFSLTVDERPHAPVRWTGTGAGSGNGGGIRVGAGEGDPPAE